MPEYYDNTTQMQIMSVHPLLLAVNFHALIVEETPDVQLRLILEYDNDTDISTASTFYHTLQASSHATLLDLVFSRTMRNGVNWS